MSVDFVPVEPGFTLKVKQLDHFSKVPVQPFPGDAGYDLVSNMDYTLEPGEYFPIKTGFSWEFPEGYVALVHPRSGMAANHGVTVLNAPGTIDSSYRGEIKVILINHHKTRPYTISKGDKIAQVVFQRYITPRVEVVRELSDTERGSNGFGSTGR